MRKRKEAFAIPCIHESLAIEVAAGKITMEEAARELHQANWTPYYDLERTQKMLAPYIAKHASGERGTNTTLL